MKSSTTLSAASDTGSRLRLTDDEMATLALETVEPWSVLLPTVDVSDDTEFLSAARRGSRSLYSRELTGADGRPGEQLRRVAQALGSPSRLLFNLLDADGRWLPNGLTFYMYGPTIGDLHTSQILSAAGVHQFRWDIGEDAWGSVSALIASICDTGFTGSAEVAAAHGQAAVVDSDGTRQLGVALNELRFEDRTHSRSSLDLALAFLRGH